VARESQPKDHAADQYGALWARITNEHHREAVELLETCDAAGLARYLFNMHKEHIVHGVSQGKPAYEGLQSQAPMRQGLSTFYRDKLVSLAEALGCLAVEDPEKTGKWGENLYRDVEDVIGRIEEHLGICIAPPNITAGLYGIRTSAGPLDQRAIDAIYAGYRIRQVLGEMNRSVCEIGSGLGWAACDPVEH
jgi:hypothetical protein